MGLFDNAIFEKAPVVCKCGHPQVDFQTKCFENCLDVYNITKDDYVMFQEFTTRDIPEEEKDELLFPFFERIPTELVRTDYCGPVEFHTICENCNKFWFSVNTNVNNGQIEDIEVITSEMGGEVTEIPLEDD